MRLRILSLLSLFILCWCSPARAQTDPSVAGRWSLIQDLPFFPPHVHVLPTGKVMIWAGDITGIGGGASGNDTRLWDPDTGLTSVLASPGYDIFCAGHSFLSDGRLLVVGGHIVNLDGISRASTYDPFTGLWTSLPNMNAGRWYPTATTLANGDTLVVSGSIDDTVGENRLPQVFQVQSDTWRNLTNAQISLDLYPRMHLAPNGKVFNSAPSTVTRYLDTSGTGAWTVVANRAVGVYRDFGSSVMYDAGKVLVMGGSDPPTATAEVIDLNASTPTWRSVASMAFARRQLNATILPDGKVLVTGGTSGTGFNNTATPVYAAEMWDPTTEKWTTLASAQIPRLYHSAVVLLPDGRLLSTGGNSYTQTEIYEPPYLFKGQRPTITAAPESVGYGQTFFVETPDAASIGQVTWIRLSSTTHAFNANQRLNRLSFSPVAGGLNIVAPSNGNLAPVGHYMLFILNSNGVPSVARITRLTSGVSGPAISALSPNSAVAGGPAFTLTVNGSNFVTDSVVQWNSAPRTTTFVSNTRLTAAIPAADIGTAGTTQVTVTNPAPTGGPSNGLAFFINGLSVSPGSIRAGGSVTAAWGGIANPAGTDWIGLYDSSTANSPRIDWMYVSCSKTAGSPRASGSCSFPAPSTLTPGGYELRLFTNNGSTLYAKSNIFAVIASATLSASPTGVPTAGTVTATWSGIAQSTATDWIGLFVPGSQNDAYLDWMYVSCSKTAGSARASGTCSFAMPATLAPGIYQLRLLANNGNTLLAGSNSFGVGTAGAMQFSSATYSVAENGGNATITITRSGGSIGAVGVTFGTSNGTATAGADYTATTQTIAFANGDTASKTVSIPIIDNTVSGGNKTVNLNLSAPTGGATLGSQGTAVLTIVDNEPAPPSAGSLALSSATYSVAENAGNATITITRSGGSTGAVGVTFATSNGTATAGSDYTATTRTVTFADGDTVSKTVSIPIIDDTLAEGNETVNLTLSNPTGGATLGSPSTAVLTIIDNETASPSLGVTPTTIAAGGTVTATWSGIANPTATDWIGLYAPGAANTAPIDWIYVSCSKASGSARASGSCSFTVPSNLAAGTYELRLLANNGYTRLTTSGSFSVTSAAGASLSESPATIPRGGTVTVTWSGITAPTAWDWIGLYAPGAANTAFIDWIYVSCSKAAGAARASGSCSFTVPATIAAGTYELRLFANNGYTRLATSNSFTVSP